jgi:hypothetical protein
MDIHAGWDWLGEAHDLPITGRCCIHQAQSDTTADRNPNTVILKVEDMACGHRASTITKPVEAGRRCPGAG